MRKILITAFLLFRLTSPAQATPIYEGAASWYSVEACKYNKDPKCPTASGRSLYELEKEGVAFAAMWNVPLGQRVRVTNLETGSSVQVFILDRGPAKRLKKRVIDLSQKAFEEIGKIDRGLIPVRVEVLL